MLKDLLEKRAAIVARIKAAHEANDDAAFKTAETELRELDQKIERAKKVDEIERAETGRPINGDVQLDREIRTRFSLGRLIGSVLDPAIDAGFEREVQPELAKRAGRAAKGLYVPTEIFEIRALTTAAGAELVSTDHRPDQYISALTAATVVRGLGATVLSGLSGNVSIPRETGAPTVGWVAENAAIPASDPDFDSVTMGPKHAGALTEWSRNMIMQASPDVEQLMRGMLARDLALAIDGAAIQGGGANEPDGVLATAGIQTQAYGVSLFDTAAEMIAKLDTANAMARRSFLSTNGVKKLAMKATDTQERPLGMDVVFHGEARAFSNQVPSDLGAGSDEHGLIYGDWADLLMGIWSEIDLLVNPFAAAAYAKGNVQIRAMATVDVAVRRPASFVSATGVTVA